MGLNTSNCSISHQILLSKLFSLALDFILRHNFAPIVEDRGDRGKGLKYYYYLLLFSLSSSTEKIRFRTKKLRFRTKSPALNYYDFAPNFNDFAPKNYDFAPNSYSELLRFRTKLL